MTHQLTIKRGLLLGVLWGTIGASVPYLTVLSYYYVRFRIQERNLGEFNYYMAWYQLHLAFTTFRFATLFFFAGLTTYITVKYYGFALTLIQQVVMTFMLEFICCLFFLVPAIMTEYDNTPNITYDNYLWFIVLNLLASLTVIQNRLKVEPPAKPC